MIEKAYKVFVNPRARRDLYDLWVDIYPQNPLAADRLVLRIDGRVQSLAYAPERGALREELSKDLRMLVEGRYLIFYRIKGRRIEITRILHGARDILQIFS